METPRDSSGELCLFDCAYWVIYDDNENGWAIGEYAYENCFYEPGYDWAREVVTVGPRIMPPVL